MKWEIRRWIIENDWLEAVVALPDQLFYNTGISTYFCVVTNRKSARRRGKVQLVDARDLWQKMRKSLGNKRKEFGAEHIAKITRLYGAFSEGERVKIMTNESFGFLRIAVERPLRLRWEITEETLMIVRADKRMIKLADGLDALVAALTEHLGLSDTDRTQIARTVDPILRNAGLNASQQKALWEALAIRDSQAPPILNRKGEPEPDPEFRDQENVPLPAMRVGFEDAA